MELIIRRSLLRVPLLLLLLLLLPLLPQLKAVSANSDIKQVAAATYARVIPCLKNRAAAIPGKFSWNALRFPDDAEEHYQQLLGQTRKYRTGIKPHSYVNYAEPWLENRFIEHFSSRPLHTFGGLIPLFVQWTDIHVHSFTPKNESDPSSSPPMQHLPRDAFNTLHAKVLRLLRPTVLYVALSQDDQGLGGLR